MTPRERILTTLNHREPDKLAIDSGSGFVFNTIHNIVANTPIANLLAMLDIVRPYR